MQNNNLRIEYVPIASLRHPEKNPRKWTKEVRAQVRESLEKFSQVDPLIVNCAPGREGVIIGGNLRFEVLKEMAVEKGDRYKIGDVIGTFNLSFTAQTNITYAVQGVNSLLSTNWTSLTTVTATSTNQAASVPMSYPDMMFYRVVSQ